MPVALRLKERGHEVKLRTLRSEVETTRAIGLDAEPVSERVQEIPLEDFRARTPAGRGLQALASLVARAEHDADDLRAVMGRARPDIVIVDCLALGACAVAEASGLPWAQFVPFPLSVSSRQRPPTGLGLKPARTIAGRTRDLALRALADTVMDAGRLARLNRVREAATAAPLRHFGEAFARAPLVLHLMSRMLDPPAPDWPRSIRTVGACGWDPPSHEPDWLAEIELPIVLVASSSESQRDNAMVACALRGLARLDVHVVATMPAERPEETAVPAGATVVEFLPHAPVLARAVCAVTHGGAGITQKALAAGVPVCVVPFGRDQPEMASRVVALEVGTKLSPRRLSPGSLREQVLAAMELRPRVQELARTMAAEAAPVRAAEQVEGLLAGREQLR